MKHLLLVAALLGWPLVCRAEDPKPRPSPRALAFSEDDRTLAVGALAGKGGELTLWDVATHKPVWRVEQPHPVRALAWAPDGKTLLAAVGKEVLLIDPGSGASRGPLGQHDQDISCLALTADGRTLAAGSDKGAIRLWDVGTKKATRTIPADTRRIHSLCFDPAGSRLVSASEGGAQLWDVATGKMLPVLKHNNFFIPSAVFTPDGKGVVTAGYDGRARVWDADTGRELARFSGQGGLSGALIHAGSHTLAVWGIGRSIALFDMDTRPPDAATKRRITALLAQMDDDSYVQRESASRELIALGWVAEPALRTAAKEAESAEVRIRARLVLTALQTRPRRLLEGHTSDLRAVTFSRDGKLIASAGTDGTIRLHEPSTGRELAVLGR
jgi:WD40 repeat protein